MVNNCLQNLVFTVHNIMELSKIRLNQFKSSTKPVNVYEKIMATMEIFRDQIDQKSINFKIKCSDQLQKC